MSDPDKRLFRVYVHEEGEKDRVVILLEDRYEIIDSQELAKKAADHLYGKGTHSIWPAELRSKLHCSVVEVENGRMELLINQWAIVPRDGEISSWKQLQLSP